MAPPDARIAAIAARQDGLVTWQQLRRAGLSEEAVRHRLRGRRLNRVHRGVYAVGHGGLSETARIRAATLATGGVASHRSAAVLWELLPAGEHGGEHVIARGDPRPGIRVHRGSLLPVERTARCGVPVTTVARTLLDVAETEPHHDAVRALGEAEVQRRITRRRLAAQLADWPGRRGAGVLRRILADDLEPAPARSRLEDLLLPLLRAAGLPRPLLNRRIAGREVDAVWPAERLVIELDGRRWHDVPGRVEADRVRDARLAAAGYVVMRFSYERIRREPFAVVAELAAALSRRAAA